MQESKVKTKCGVGFMSLLSILFIGLKLGQVINWSWVWVLAPLWLPTGIVIGILVLALIVCAIYGTIKARCKK